MQSYVVVSRSLYDSRTKAEYYLNHHDEKGLEIWGLNLVSPETAIIGLTARPSLWCVSECIPKNCCDLPAGNAAVPKAKVIMMKTAVNAFKAKWTIFQYLHARRYRAVRIAAGARMRVAIEARVAKMVVHQLRPIDVRYCRIG